MKEQGILKSDIFLMTLIIDFQMQKITSSKQKRIKQERPFYCLLNQQIQRSTNNIVLHSHIKSKHLNQIQEQDDYAKLLQSQQNQQKAQTFQNFQEFEMKNIAVNIGDIKKYKIVSKTVLKINQVLKNEGLFDIDQQDEIQDYQSDLNGQLNIGDIKISQYVQQLIQVYNMQKLYQQPFSFPQLQFRHHYSGNVKVISMKNELSQFYNMEWASKIHLQLDLFALQIWINLNNEQIQRIQNCQSAMWGDYYQMIPILQEYYQQILNNHLEQ